MESLVYHGGDWAGNACRIFFGLCGKKKNKSDYNSVVEYLVEDMVCNYDDELNTMPDTEVEKYCLFLREVFLPLCKKISDAMLFTESKEQFSESQLKEGISACKEAVAFYRKELVLKDPIVILQRRITVKHHILESHVAPFAEHHKATSLFSESVVETVHKEVNIYLRRFCSIKDPILRVRKVLDTMNMNFKAACRTVKKVVKRKLKQLK